MDMNKQCKAAAEQMRLLNEERIAMVTRREKPGVIHAVCDAYRSARMAFRTAEIIRRLTDENQAG